MNNKGGRGKKAPYETTHVRIPSNIKSIVDELSSSYKEYVSESGCLDFDNKIRLPIVPAIYLVVIDNEVIYVGQTKNLRSRWSSHHLLKEIKELNQTDCVKIAWLTCDDLNLLTSLEKVLIGSLNPTLNNGDKSLANLTSYQPKWKSGKTKTIRVPEAIAEQVLEIAHSIDEDNFIVTSEFKSVLAEGLKLPSNKGGEIKKCLARIGRMAGFEVEQDSRKRWIVSQKKL